ncbi:MAG: NUDIX hydrolase [Gammaproteobacteria bacterium]
MTQTPAATRLAGTLLAVRDGSAGIEVFMVRRAREIDFIAGALVFPGGKVDAADAAIVERGLGTGLAGLDDDDARARVAALREAYEEAGILVARDGGGSIVDAAHVDAAEADRARVAAGELDLAGFLEARGWRLATGEMAPFSRWITPRSAPKRFDTMFYLVQAPPGQDGSHDGTESIESRWIDAAEAVKAAEQGTLPIVFPTRMNLMRLAAFPTVAAALAGSGMDKVVPVEPFMQERPDGRWICIRDDAGYSITEMPVSKAFARPLAQGQK